MDDNVYARERCTETSDEIRLRSEWERERVNYFLSKEKQRNETCCIYIYVEATNKSKINKETEREKREKSAFFCVAFFCLSERRLFRAGYFQPYWIMNKLAMKACIGLFIIMAYLSIPSLNV